MKLLSALCAAAFLTLSLSASAQDYMGMFNASNAAGVNIAATIATNAAIKKQAGNAARGKSRRTAGERIAAPSSSANTHELTFVSDSGVSRRVKSTFREAVQRADPAQADHIAAVLASQDVLADFDRDMAPYGFRSNNLADAMTAYWVTMWMMANRAPVPSKDKVTAAYVQVTNNMLSGGMAADASCEELQQTTEALIYETMFALGQRANAERARDAQRQLELATHVQRNLLKIGVDLQALRLTRSGFVGR